ncbi:ATP-binding cassette domain-containing protein [Saccharopolyspora rhizosphaerae]|uniref:Nickel import system ATP-binding protein NikD n=1 Tax=Saccharopolyspora rhizosphaerae TaxID=2492662 RepID=A0A3R8NZ64_9PSEU|nr:ATP-binding cassette domain-containing protein [Saccharopolyspora rhizosphaerae]RRO13016.1 ATP-binding cassette domain-containing protein [Saccharopolyspora rhizosphaerae]
MGGPVAELRGLTVHVDTGRWSETVLEAVDLVVPAGQITVLLGESGCGKSMLVAALTGTLPESAQSTGEVRITSTPVLDQRRWRHLRAGTVGLVPQDGVTAFSADDTVGAQLRELHRLHQAGSVDEACAAACYPTDVIELFPHQHSAGQVQRAALAAALLPAPELLVVDEPTASVETSLSHQIWRNLRAQADTGAGVLAVTQDVHRLLDTGVPDRLRFMREGRITAAGTVAEVSASADPYLQGLLRHVG